MKSRAVVACDGNGNGAVLWCSGPAIQAEVENCGTCLQDLGLDDAPRGVSVWEGNYVEDRSIHEGDQIVPKGEFRSPTPEEWAVIQESRAPWEPWQDPDA